MKPDGKGAGQLEAIHRFLVSGAKLMRRLVALDTQGMEEVAHGGVEADFAPESGEQIGLRGFAIELDAGTGGNVLRQGFAELPQFDQRGVGVGCEDLLGSAGELQKDRVVFGEKSEIAGNDQAPNLLAVTCRRHGQNLTHFASAGPVLRRLVMPMGWWGAVC